MKFEVLSQIACETLMEFARSRDINVDNPDLPPGKRTYIVDFPTLEWTVSNVMKLKNNSGEAVITAWLEGYTSGKKEVLDFMKQMTKGAKNEV